MAVRADLADVRLAASVFAPHYAAPLPRVMLAAADLTGGRAGTAIAELQVGECFEVLELTATQAWGVVRDSGLVGYVRRDALAVTAQ